MHPVFSLARFFVRRIGYDLHKLDTIEVGQDAFADMRKLTGSRSSLTIFDVGANVGQTIEHFRALFPRSTIYSFEPSPDTYRALCERCGGIPDVHLNNCALGSENGVLELIENTSADMSSFLEPGRDSWGAVKRRTPVNIKTIDGYCELHEISRIDILKSDTQGFDLEVLKGASGLFDRHCIHLVYLEIGFGELYKNAARLDHLYGFLADRGFALVSFYKTHYRDDLAKWTDALFVNGAAS